MPLSPYEGGLLILHEGQFLGGNASLSLVSEDFSIQADGIFKTVNAQPLGDVAQSMAFYGETSYIVVNNSQKVEVVESSTMEVRATIDGRADGDLFNPRYMAFLDGKGYVTNWGEGTDPSDDFVAVVDLASHEVAEKIPVEEGPERILSDGNRLYIAHQGGFSQNNLLSVMGSDSKVETLTVGDVPNSMQFDGRGNLWVLCGGNPSFTGNETGGSLYRIDLTDLGVERVLVFAANQHPGQLQRDGNHLFFLMEGGVYRLPADGTESVPQLVFSGIQYYGMYVSKGTLYGVDAGDFASPGTLEARDLQGQLLRSTEVGYVPSAIYPFLP